jgi:hypothetical protein
MQGVRDFLQDLRVTARMLIFGMRPFRKSRDSFPAIFDSQFFGLCLPTVSLQRDLQNCPNDIGLRPCLHKHLATALFEYWSLQSPRKGLFGWPPPSQMLPISVASANRLAYESKIHPFFIRLADCCCIETEYLLYKN